MESESWSARIADALHARWPDGGFDAAGRVQVRTGWGDVHIVTVHSKLRRDESPALQSVAGAWSTWLWRVPVTILRSSGRPDRLVIPQPGDLIAAFSPQFGRCFRMVYSHQLQATHCSEAPAWKGVWRDRTGRSWYVEACGEHAPMVTNRSAEGF